MHLSGKEQLNRNYSGQVEASQMGSLAKDISASRKKLIDQGVTSLIASLVTDLQAPQLPQQLRALHAISNLTASKIGVAALQETFREHGGLPPLISITRLGVSEESEESKVASCRATEALFHLTRNNFQSRQAAVEGGALEAVLTHFSDHDRMPPTLFPLQVLHSFVAHPPAEEAAQKLFLLGGIDKLVELLKRVVGTRAGHEAKEVWLKEILAVIEPCASHCEQVVLLLAKNMRVLCQLLCTCEEPLCLSLALDIFEEVVGHKHLASSQQLAVQGVIGALVYAVSFRGLGSKAAAILAKLCAGDPVLLPLLQAALQAEDIAALVQTAALGSQAKDVEAAESEALLGELLLSQPSTTGTEETYSASILCGLVLGECVGPCLKMQRVSGRLRKAASNQLGQLTLRNLPKRHSREVAVALSQFLPHVPSFLTHLGEHELLFELVAAFLEEQRQSNSAIGAQATAGVINILRACPEEELCTPSQVADHADATPPAGDGPGSGANGQIQRDVAFQVGGREIMAPSSVMEQASPAIARTLAAIPDASSAAVVIPSIPTIPPDRLYKLFSVAVEFAESGQLGVDDSNALDLWAVASVVQMEELMRRCEELIRHRLTTNGNDLLPALHLVAQYPNTGTSLAEVCSRHIASEMEKGWEHLPDIQSALQDSAPQFQLSFHSVLQRRVLHRIQRMESNAGDNGDVGFSSASQSPDRAEEPEVSNSADGDTAAAAVKRKALRLSKATSFSDWIQVGESSHGDRQNSRQSLSPTGSRGLTEIAE